jgi:hypothetical protein
MSRLVNLFGALKDRMSQMPNAPWKSRPLRPLDSYPDELFRQHWQAAILRQNGKIEEAGQVIKLALANDACYVDGPIAAYDRILAEDHFAAGTFLHWYINQRDLFIFNQIETYVDSLRSSRYLDYPLIVQIETIALCNAACTFCQYPDLGRKGDKLSDQTID